MQFAKRSIMAALVAAAAGAAVAGEDSTERLHGFGPAFWELDCGHGCFAAAAARQPAEGEAQP